MPVGDVGETLGAARVAEDLVAFLDVGEAVVEQREDVGRDLLAEAVAGAEVLVDPDLHRRCPHLFVECSAGHVGGNGRPARRRPGRVDFSSQAGKIWTRDNVRQRTRSSVHGVGCAGVASDAGRVRRDRGGGQSWLPSTSDASPSTSARSAISRSQLKAPRGRGRRPPAPAPGRPQAGPHARGAAARDQGPARPGRLPEREALGHPA